MTGAVRCAIYTRKSTNEGLDQEFNSLDAQREACEAYIRSQRGEGWTLLPTQYEDGGYSGGNVQRPALTRLLDNVRAGKIDMIVIYKIDRLTRNLADFAKMIEVLEAHACSFVSITQSFSTRTSMGRLTLNMLLSFAQFERELGSERVRDKIAAAKAKGMWTGGTVPLGYDVVDRSLVVNEPEARLVRTIMRLYVNIGNVRDLLAELRDRSIFTKRRAGGRGGAPFQKTALYTLLKNELYIGRTKHRDKSYPGRHPAIVSQKLWDKVQEQIARNARKRRERAVSGEPSLLAGIIFDGRGHRLAPSHTSKGNRRYHYYVSTKQGPRPRQARSPTLRIPAVGIDKQIREQLVDYLTGAEHMRIWLADGASIDDAQSWAMAYRQLGREAAHADRQQFRKLLDDLKARVTVAEKSLELAICGNALEKLRTGLVVTNRPPVMIHGPAQLPKVRPSLHLTIPAEISSGTTSRTRSLVRLLIRAYDARVTLFDPSAEVTIGPSDREALYRLARLSFLAPDIVTAVFDGRSPKGLNAKALYEMPHVPADWARQRQLLGFS